MKEAETGLLFCRLWQLISYPDLLQPHLLKKDRQISVSSRLEKSKGPPLLSLTKNAQSQHSSLGSKAQTAELKIREVDEPHRLSLSATVIEMRYVSYFP